MPLTVVERGSRVNKLDSELLDHELLDIIREPIGHSLSFLSPHLVDRFKPEIDTLIKAVLFGLSVGSSTRRATYGQSLQNLTYQASLRRLRLFGVLLIGGDYLWTKLLQRLSSKGWADAPHSSLRNKVWRLLDRLERWSRVAALLNFWAFLVSGQYKTVLERMLGLRLVQAHPQLTHSVSFEFLNRQMVWHAFTEFVMFALPLVNIARTRLWMTRTIRQLLGLSRASDVDPKVQGLEEDQCAICFSSQEEEDCQAVNPYSVECCGRVYCYVCVRTRMMAEGEGCRCLYCGGPIRRILPAGALSIQK